MREIKQCPFCGGNGKLDFFDEYSAVYCTSCFAEGPPVDIGENYDQNLKSIEAWNKRVK